MKKAELDFLSAAENYLLVLTKIRQSGPNTGRARFIHLSLNQLFRAITLAIKERKGFVQEESI